MYLGNAVELANKHSLYNNPKHPYTKALLSAVPVPDPKQERNKKIEWLAGDLPSPIEPPSGCVFRTRCPEATKKCAQAKPSLNTIAHSHQVACTSLDNIIINTLLYTSTHSTCNSVTHRLRCGYDQSCGITTTNQKMIYINTKQ